VLSYAQNGEDVLLSRVFQGPSGFYVDAGACHPIIDSVTYAFYERGWRGINIEPCETMFNRLKELRPRDINLNLAISNTNTNATFYECPNHIPLSTMNPQVAGEITEAGGVIEERPMEVKTLSTVLQEHGVSTIDFLKVDVEGHEKQVLQGNDWNRFCPRVVIVESTHPRTTRSEYQHWESILLDADYTFATFDGLNRFYVSPKDHALIPELERPLSVFDRYVTHQHLAQVRFFRDSLQRSLSNNDERSTEHLLALLTHMIKQPMLCRESPPMLAQVLREIETPGQAQ